MAVKSGKAKMTKRERAEFVWGWAFILPTMLGLLILNIIPIFQTIYQSFFKTGSFGRGNIFVGTENYERLFSDGMIWQALLNTLKYAIIEVPFSIAIALVLAVLLNRKMRGRSIYRAIYFLPMVAAPAAVVSTVLPYMKRGAHIINVCSIAAFAPTPRMTVYCSTKSFIYAFSRSLGEELRKDGISVTAVCPGPMDTEFLPIAGIHGNSKMFNSLPRCNVREVAEKTIRASRRRRAVYTNKLLFKLYRIIAKILPHALVVKFTKC